MAILSIAAQAALQDAIDTLVKTSAREMPLSQDTLQRITVFINTASAIDTSGLVMESFRDRPVSGLILLVYATGLTVLSATEKAQLVDASGLMTTGTAYETPFAEDVIQRLAPAAESTGFLSQGAFYESIKDRPISTMLQWVLAVGD